MLQLLCLMCNSSWCQRLIYTLRTEKCLFKVLLKPSESLSGWISFRRGKTDQEKFELEGFLRLIWMTQLSKFSRSELASVALNP